MSIPTHLLITTAGVRLLGLEGQEALLAYVFGTFLDLDHIFKLPAYLKENGLKIKRYFHWRTFIQEPISLLWVIPVSFYLGTYVPIVFFSSHLLLDYLVSFKKSPFYPFSNYSTRGFLLGVSNRKKEVFTFLLFLIINLILPFE